MTSAARAKRTRPAPLVRNARNAWYGSTGTPPNGDGKAIRLPIWLRSNFKVCGSLTGTRRSITTGPTMTCASGLGHLLAMAMSPTASRMPAAARMPIRIGQPQRRTGCGCGGDSLTCRAPTGTRHKADEDRQVIGGDRGQGDQRDEQEHVDGRDARERPHAGTPAGKTLQVAEETRGDRRQSVQSRQVPEDEGDQQRFGREQGPRAAIDRRRRRDRPHDVADERLARLWRGECLEAKWEGDRLVVLEAAVGT